MKPFHDPCDVYKAQESDVKLVKASGNPATYFYALQKVLHQMPCLVAVFVQTTRLFTPGPARDDDLYGLVLSELNNCL